MVIGSNQAESHETSSQQESVTTPEARSRRPRFLMNSQGQTAIIWLLVMLSIPLSHLANTHFPSTSFVRNVITLCVFLVMISFGQGLAILTGGIDLSLPAIVSLAAYSTGYLTSTGMPTVVAVMIALALSATVGACNGSIIARTDFPPFIVTLAMASIVASLLLGFSRSAAPAQKAPQALSMLFEKDALLLAVPMVIWIFLVTVVAAAWLQGHTVFGRYCYAIGNSVPAAQIARLPAARTFVMAYVTAAIFYGLGGVMLLGYSSGADLNIGTSWLLPSIAAVVVGGSSIKGGSGSYLGTVGGAILLTVIDIDTRAIGLEEGYRQSLYGLIIIFALVGTKFASAKKN